VTDDDLPSIERLDLYAAMIRYPDTCERQHLNPLGLPHAPGRPGRAYRVAWEDVDLVISLALFDFGAIRTDEVIEREYRRPDRSEAWWIAGVLMTREWAEAHIPRPVKKDLLDDLFPPVTRPNEEAA
jgi:hypothetical protein